jgi:hypothetical protein
MNFIILSTQRSGTHMLKSALNSHSKITCHGEILIKKEFEKKKELFGCIVMISHIEKMKFKPDKIIYLKRNFKDTALSQLGNIAHKKIEGKNHNPHKPKPYNFVFNNKQVKIKEDKVKKQHNKIKEYLKDKDYLEVNYENINYKEIQDYLNVNQEKIKPQINKNLHKYIII